MDHDTVRRATAEFFGTFWLTFGGCGAAVLSAAFPELGIGFLGVAFAFGLTVLTMAYAVGHISGGHFNPAVTLGLWSARRCATRHVLPYIVAQVIGAILAAGVLYSIATGKAGWVPNGFASNGYGALSPGRYSLEACLVMEALTTFFFLFIIIGTTSKGAATGFAGIPDRLCPGADPPHLDPDHQHLRQSRRVAPVRPCSRAAEAMSPALAVLAGTGARCRDGRGHGALALRAGHDHRDDDRREADPGVGIDGTHSVSRPHPEGPTRPP